jgi:hypothetical protein
LPQAAEAAAMPPPTVLSLLIHQCGADNVCFINLFISHHHASLACVLLLKQILFHTINPVYFSYKKDTPLLIFLKLNPSSRAIAKMNICSTMVDQLHI